MLPSGNRTQASHEPLIPSPTPFWTNWAFACKTETLGSLYGHGLLILIKSSKSKNQVMYEPKFKHLLSSTCQINPDRRVLDLESEALEARV